MVYIVFHEEGNCGCELDPYDYHILGIFNTQDEANRCEEENKKRINEIKEREEAQSERFATFLNQEINQEEYDKMYEEKEEFYMHYATFIEEVDTPFTLVKGDTVYVVIQSYRKGGNFEAVKGIFQTEEEANTFSSQQSEELYIFPFTIA